MLPAFHSFLFALFASKSILSQTLVHLSVVLIQISLIRRVVFFRVCSLSLSVCAFVIYLLFLSFVFFFLFLSSCKLLFLVL